MRGRGPVMRCPWPPVIGPRRQSDRVVRDCVEAFEADYDDNRRALETPGGTGVAMYDDQNRFIAHDDGLIENAYNEACE